MYCCALCGKLLWQVKIFCENCFSYPQKLYFRKTKNYEHYYFYTWDAFSKALVSNLKDANHQPTLNRLSTFLRYEIQTTKGLSKSKRLVLVAPNSKQKFYHKNHAYLLAGAFGYKDISDILLKTGEQKGKNQGERKKVQIICKERRRVKEILVIDDVLTTGATMDAIYHLLKPQKMQVVTLAYVEKQVNFIDPSRKRGKASSDSLKI